MPSFQDHNRRTPAANADILGGETDLALVEPPTGDALAPHDDPLAAKPPPQGPGAAEPGQDLDHGYLLPPAETHPPSA